jgi:hypothetical protein
LAARSVVNTHIASCSDNFHITTPASQPTLAHIHPHIHDLPCVFIYIYIYFCHLVFLNPKKKRIKTAGDNHPVPESSQRLASLVVTAQLACAGAIGFGPMLLRGIGADVPPWLSSLQSPMAFLGIFFLGNSVTTQLMSTGAFEVSYMGRTVHSKLETGEMPDVYSVVEAIERLGLRPAF